MNFELTIPVLNEEETLCENVLKTVKFLNDNIDVSFKVIIADNGSTDQTKELGLKLEKNNKEVEYLEIGEKGVGLALRTSWMKSNADLVGYMDLDLATDLKYLKEVVEIYKQGEGKVINGSRLLPDSKVIGRSLKRTFTSKIFNKMVRSFLKVDLSDGMCGFKFFDRKKVQELISTGITLNGWFFSTEILVKSIWQNEKIIEIPVIWTDDVNNSKVNILDLAKAYTKEIFRLRRERNNFIKKNLNDL